MIKLHDSQTRSIREFTPQDSSDIKMYVCGPTVYGPAHIGNTRPAIVFDQLFRLLRYLHGEKAVTYVRNITDIDDKIIQAANERGVSITRITDTATLAYHDDLRALACLEPTMEPRATDYVEPMLGLIECLIHEGHAYEINGEVFFHVPSNPHPGLANHVSLDSGSRVELDAKKRDPRDFVLWKPAKPGEPSWSSPWGEGRPGWHIECSAMIHMLLGDTIDIHGGGQDLRFPHHEAECAQSACAHQGRPLANYWLHNGLLTVEGEKMSKSRGNVLLMRDLLSQYPGESIRYYFLSTHYRSPMDFSKQALESAHRALCGLYDTLNEFHDVNYPEVDQEPSELLEALCGDLNTPAALAALHRSAAGLANRQTRSRSMAELLSGGRLLGLFNYTPRQWRTLGVDVEAVEELIQRRKIARDGKDYQEADRIRQQLTSMGITLADGAHGTDWRKI